MNSLRHGFATDAHAIGVPERRMRTMGNWAAGTSKGGTDVIDGYIDELAPATAASWRFFGWLVTPSSATSASPFSCHNKNTGKVIVICVSAAHQQCCRSPFKA